MTRPRRRGVWEALASGVAHCLFALGTLGSCANDPAPPQAETAEGGAAGLGTGAGGGATSPDVLRACVVGAWRSGIGDCACPADPEDFFYSPECEEDDCVETAVSVYAADGTLVECTIRRSEQVGRFSSTTSGLGPPPLWGWLVDERGMLVHVISETSASERWARCTDASLTFLSSPERPGELALERVPPGLEEALFGALESGDWSDVRYEP